MKTIISAGHICLDITPMIPGRSYRSISDFLIPGRLVNTEGVAVHLGGSVGNTGLALKKLGADVRLLGKIGRDAFGGIVKGLVAEQGASGLLEDPDVSTSYTIVIAPPGLDRCFLHNPGANDSFTDADIPDSALADAAMFHFGYPTLMRSMFENDGAYLVSMFRRVRQQGIATSLDLTAVDPEGPAGTADWMRILSSVLPYVDFFVPSYEELLYMMDRERWNRLPVNGGDQISLEKDAVPLARQALALGCRAVLLKCGVKGMVLVTSGCEQMAAMGGRLELSPDKWADRMILQPCFHVDHVKSATGAGDASIAAFLLAASSGRKPEECTALAAAEGACAVTTYDLMSGLRPLDELEQWIRAGWAIEPIA